MAIVVAASADGQVRPREAWRLAGALAVFPSRPGSWSRGRRCLDAGASTGGFRRAAAHDAAQVVADVGYGLARVRLGRTSACWCATASCPGARPPRSPTARSTSWSGTLVHLAAARARRVARRDRTGRRPGADGQAAVRGRQGPGRQGRGRPGPGAAGRGRRGRGRRSGSARQGAHLLATSPLPGPSGNVEFFLWLRRGPADLDADAIHAAVHAAAPPGRRVKVDA